MKKRKFRLCKKRYAKKVHTKALALLKNLKLEAEVLRIHYNMAKAKHNITANAFFDIIVLCDPKQDPKQRQLTLFKKRFIRIVAREIRRNA